MLKNFYRSPSDTAGGQAGDEQQGPQPKPQNNSKLVDENGRPVHPAGQNGQAGEPKRSKKPLIILGIIILVLAVVAFIAWFLTRNHASTDDAYTDGNSITIAPKISGYVTELDIDDNKFVHAGDLLLRIDPRDYVNARDEAKAGLELAQAQLTGAEAAYEIAKVRYPAQLAQAQAQKVSAEATQFQARQSALRQESVERRATTAENIDSATAQAKSAASQVDYNQAQVNIAKLIPQNLEQAAAQVKQWQGQVDQARAQLAQAELNLSYTEVKAPQDGWVTRRNVQLGSYAQPGQGIFILVTTDVWVVANFKETQLDRMRVNQRVEIDCDAYPGLHLKGYVQSIQMGSGSRFSTFPAENATGNYVKIVQRVPVKLVIDQGLDPNIPLPLGLSVEPTVYLK